MTSIQLLFVYKADHTPFGIVTGFIHKIVSPESYACRLCALTYGSLFMKQEWKTFLDDLPFRKTFLYQDEFEKRYRKKVDLPAVFFVDQQELFMLLTPEEINACHTVTELAALLSYKIKSGNR